MGAAHSQAWRTAPHVFDLPLSPGHGRAVRPGRRRGPGAARRLGWAAAQTDWRALIGRDDVQLIDICTPGDSHAEIAIAALDAGQHVLCEKPLANTVAEAEAMAAAAARASAARRPLDDRLQLPPGPGHRAGPRAGRPGGWVELRHVRASYLQDWLVDPAFPLTWRLEREHAGSGALGDLGAHIVDLAQYLTGELITGVSGLTTTFVGERPRPDGTGPGPVTVDDAALFTARLGAGVVASFEATRFASGRKNGLRIELNGERGSLAFDLERLNELEFHDHTEDARTAGFRRILVTEPTDPYVSAWWPPGHVLGWEHTFTHEVADLVNAIARTPTRPRRSPTASRCSGCWTRCRTAPSMSPGGRRSPPRPIV